MVANFNEDYGWFFEAEKSGSPLAGVSVYAYNDDDTQVVNQTTSSGPTPPAGRIAEQQIRDTAYSVTGTTETPDPNTPHTIIAAKYGEEIFVQTIAITARGFTKHFFATDAFITETTPATVDAYTGITINHTTDTITLDGTGVTPVNTIARLYDYCRREAETTPQVPTAPRGVIDETPDGVNYNPIAYDLVIDGFSFPGSNSVFVFASGKGLTLQGTGGNIPNITITGDLLVNTEADLSNVTVTGDIRVNTGANSTLSWSNVSCSGSVFNDAASNTLTINASGSSLTAGDPGTGVGQTNIVTSVPITVTATKDGVPVEGAAVYIETTLSEVALNDVTNASGVASGTFAGSTPVAVDSDVSGVKSGSGPTPFVYFPLGGTIENTGYTATALLTED